MTPDELRALIEEVQVFNYERLKVQSTAPVKQKARAFADRCLLACGWTRELDEKNDCWFWSTPDGRYYTDSRADKDVPNPILSRDDADALLPKRYGLANIEWQQHGARYRARVSRLPNLWPPFSVGFGHTEPCARTAAALRAVLREMDTPQSQDRYP